MNAETVTLISGVVLLGVFAFVGWRLRRRERRLQGKEGSDR